MAFIF